MRVTPEQRIAYNSDSVHKELRVFFPRLDLNVLNDQIYSESFRLKESILEGTNIEFVGCIASQMSVQLYGVEHKLKNEPVVVYMRTRDNEGNYTEYIPLFHGIVDSVKMQSNRQFKTITAYDELYTKGQMDVVGWYYKIPFPTRLKVIRDSLFTYLGLRQVYTTLPNDDVIIEKQFAPKSLKALSVIKSICQINGCFGIINRDGAFDYKFLSNSMPNVYPSVTLFPSGSLFPVGDSERARSGLGRVANNFGYYKQIDYEEFVVKPVEQLQIRESEKDEGVTVGDENGNKYIIQANMFAYKLGKTKLKTVAKNIFDHIQGVTFHPCSTDNNGLPFVEVGDVVSYSIVQYSGGGGYQVNTFNVMSREMNGIQALRDNYVAEGEEEQSVFITDLQTQIETIKQSGGGGDTPVPEDVYTKEEIDTKFDDFSIDINDDVAEQISGMETPTGFNIVSCYNLPSRREAKTLYLVQSNVVVL